MNMDDDKEFMVTRLEEQMLDIAEQDVCRIELSTVISHMLPAYSPIFWEPIGDWYRRPF